MRTLNEARTRLISDEDALFAIVGYEGTVKNDVFTGTHAGCFHTVDAAESWLRGEREPDFRVQHG